MDHSILLSKIQLFQKTNTMTNTWGRTKTKSHCYQMHRMDHNILFLQVSVLPARFTALDHTPCGKHMCPSFPIWRCLQINIKMQNDLSWGPPIGSNACPSFVACSWNTTLTNHFAYIYFAYLLNLFALLSCFNKYWICFELALHLSLIPSYV